MDEYLDLGDRTFVCRNPKVRCGLVLDRDLKSASRLSFHPNINTVTFTVSAVDFHRFLAACGNTVQHVTV